MLCHQRQLAGRPGANPAHPRADGPQRLVLCAREVIRFASIDYVGMRFGQAYRYVLPLLDCC